MPDIFIQAFCTVIRKVRKIDGRRQLGIGNPASIYPVYVDTSKIVIFRNACLQVKGNDSSIIGSYLSVSSDCKNWHKRWLTVRQDFVLYYFKAPKVSKHYRSSLHEHFRTHYRAKLRVARYCHGKLSVCDVEVS